MVNPQRRLIVLAPLAATLSMARARGARAGSELPWEVDSQIARTLNQLYPRQRVRMSEQVRLELPGIAEDGSIVPVHCEADLAQVRALTLISDKNPVPVIARFQLHPDVEASVATRVKLAESGKVLLVAETASGLFAALAETAVMRGGCA